MASEPRKIELVFYRSAAGNEPVRDWLGGLPTDDRRAIGMDLQRVQYRWPVGMPLVRPMGKGLFEVRTGLSNKTIARVLVCFTAANSTRCTGLSKRRGKRLLRI